MYRYKKKNINKIYFNSRDSLRPYLFPSVCWVEVSDWVPATSMQPCLIVAPLRSIVLRIAPSNPLGVKLLKIDKL